MLTRETKSSILGLVREILTKKWSLSSAGRASALQAGGHRFEPYSDHHFMARQFSWLERQPVTLEVDGSSPFRVARNYLDSQVVFNFIFGSIAQLVEQRTENPRVSGSIPLRATTVKDSKLNLLSFLLYHNIITIEKNDYFYEKFSKNIDIIFFYC